MDLRTKRDELINLIRLFLDKKKTVKELRDFSWEMIDQFSNINEKNIPPFEEIENVLWFAVWQLQHLADEEHMNDGTLERELKTTLGYLLNQIPMPADAYGLRPSQNKHSSHNN